MQISARESGMPQRFSQYKLQGVNKIYIMFDGDKAGKEGSKKLYNALKDTFVVKELELPEGSDPGSLSTEDINSLKEYLYGSRSDS